MITRAKLEADIASAKARGMLRIQYTVTRTKPPAPRGAPIRLWGRSGPQSMQDQVVAKVNRKEWTAWWSVEEVDVWLHATPATAPGGLPRRASKTAGPRDQDPRG